MFNIQPPTIKDGASQGCFVQHTKTKCEATKTISVPLLSPWHILDFTCEARGSWYKLIPNLTQIEPLDFLSYQDPCQHVKL